MLQNLISGSTGLIHLIASLVALVTGMYILLSKKGTKSHKRIGYLYVIMMLTVNLTAFMIYRLFGKFAIFHWFAVISLGSILAGMIPVLRKKGSDYLVTHFSFMYWSVVGLYAAFVSEIFTRLPQMLAPDFGFSRSKFFMMLNISIVLVMSIGTFFFVKYKSKWERDFQDLNHEK